jgi:opine dehydrogenase
VPPEKSTRVFAVGEANTPATRDTRHAERPVAIVGGGNAAHALAVHFARMRHPVHLVVRNLAHLPESTREGSIKAVGKIDGRFDMASVSDQPGPALEAADTVFVATVATAYADVARLLAPYLREGHSVVLFSGKFAGCVEFEKVLHELDVHGIRVAETDALFASRVQSDGSIWVRGVKRWNLVTAPRRSETSAALGLLSQFFDGLEAAENVVQRGLTDFGALAHPITMLANMNQVDRGVPFLFYCEGFTDKTVVLLEALEEEFRSVAAAYGTSLLSSSEWLDRYYGCEHGNVLKAMKSVPNYQTSKAPDSLDHRYLHEDVACTLVPLRELAALARLQTPMTDAIVAMATALNSRDYVGEGRGLATLGWAGLTHDALMARLC